MPKKLKKHCFLNKFSYHILWKIYLGGFMLVAAGAVAQVVQGIIICNSLDLI